MGDRKQTFLEIFVKKFSLLSKIVKISPELRKMFSVSFQLLRILSPVQTDRHIEPIALP